MSSRRTFLRRAVAAGITAGSALQIGCGADLKVGDPRDTPRRPMAKGARIKSVIRREETVLRHGGVGDNWHMSWAADDRQYVSLCDGYGWSESSKGFYNTRLFSIDGAPRDAAFHDVAGYPELILPFGDNTPPRYYGFGTLALEGCLYQYLSTWNRALTDGLKPNELRFIGSKLIYSLDNGHTWRNQDGSTPVVWEDWGQRSRETMVFFEEDQEAFSLLTVLQMGRNYEANKDGYVYVYAPNGNTEGTMNELVMFRVPKAQLLKRSAYEYFAGHRVDGNAHWSGDIAARAPVHVFPRGWVNTLLHPYAWQPSVIYNAPLDLYLMANWGTGCAPDGTFFGKPSYLGFWSAPHPWGPWTQIHEETAWLPANDAAARAYQPQIAPKWIAPDGKSFWLVWTDYQGESHEEMQKLTREYLQGARAEIYSPAGAKRGAAIMRKHQPYYSFNVQRVDLVVA